MGAVGDGSVGTNGDRPAGLSSAGGQSSLPVTPRSGLPDLTDRIMEYGVYEQYKRYRDDSNNEMF